MWDTRGTHALPMAIIMAYDCKRLCKTAMNRHPPCHDPPSSPPRPLPLQHLTTRQESGVIVQRYFGMTQTVGLKGTPWTSVTQLAMALWCVQDPGTTVETSETAKATTAALSFRSKV